MNACLPPARLLALVLFLSLRLSFAAAQEPVQSAPSPEIELGRGNASWYGPRFDGRLTSSGERFDMNGLTAAHPTLPLGTWVRVRNLANGREVLVRINDRAKRMRDRIIDLSKAAAARLGFVHDGKAPVVLLEHQALSTGPK